MLSSLFAAIDCFNGDFAVVADVFEADGDTLGDARLLHGDAVEGAGAGHRLFRVRDDDKLRPLEEFVEHGDEAFDVGLVKRRINLVEYAKWTGAAAEDGQQQRHASQRLFAAAE